MARTAPQQTADAQIARNLFTDLLVARLREELAPTATHATVAREASLAFERCDVSLDGATVARCEDLAAELVESDAQQRRCLCNRYGCAERIPAVRARLAYERALAVRVKRGMTPADAAVLLESFDARPSRRTASKAA
jgi:hypothetical protein